MPARFSLARTKLVVSRTLFDRYSQRLITGLGDVTACEYLQNGHAARGDEIYGRWENMKKI